MERISRREGLFLMLGASQVALRGAAAAAVTHDSLVAIFGPDVVSYWKFENNGSDERSTQDATVTGSPELNVNTIVDLDTIAEGAPGDGKCIAWPGSGGVFAEAAHNAAHKTAQGAIAITFQRDTADQKSVLVAADASAAAGGLSVEVTPSGQPRAFLRRQSDGAPVILTGQAGDVQLDEAYTLIFKWGSEGLSLALWDADGTLVRRLTAPLTDGVTGTSPIRFGAWHTGVDQHDGPYGRVIWLQRRISDSEEQVLARARTIGRPDPGNIALIGAWPMSEPSGNTFADTVGGNTATLAVPSWTFATHENNRPGIVAGSDHALEVSNGGPAIPMAAGYKQAEMSLVLYVEPRGELRGCQYWNESDERFGRELLAYCDNGSTPGSFAIYRRRNGVAGLLGLSGTPQWRLGGYVRDSSGTKVYFGGGVSGISAAVLPVDTAKRIVLTQGLNGARLYLDDSEVASLPSVTQGWASLTAPISLGSSSTTGHANDRASGCRTEHLLPRPDRWPTGQHHQPRRQHPGRHGCRSCGRRLRLPGGEQRHLERHRHQRDDRPARRMSRHGRGSAATPVEPEPERPSHVPIGYNGRWRAAPKRPRRSIRRFRRLQVHRVQVGRQRARAELGSNGGTSLRGRKGQRRVRFSICALLSI
jgi:hypothetical protein